MKNLIFQSILKLSILCSIILFSLSSAYATGVLDPTFGTNGRVSTSVGNFAQAKALVIQPDGKIVVAGDVSRDGTKRDIVMVRYNPNGSLDKSFGDGGKVFTAVSNYDDWANSLALQPDGKIVVVGSTQPDDKSASGDFLLVRYHTNGLLDSGFGSGGVVTVNRGIYDVFNAVAVQTDGKIVAAGGTSDADGQAAVFRFNPNGTLDITFADSGFFFYNFSGYRHEYLQALALLPNGRILVGGSTHNAPNQPILLADFLLELQSDGLLAPDFGNQGRVFNTTQLYPDLPTFSNFDLEILPDGKIVTVSAAFRRRYLSDGTRDPAITVGGFGGTKVAARSDGRLVVLNVPGYYQHGPPLPIYIPPVPVGLYSNENRLIGGSNLGGADAAIQPDNKVVVLSAVTNNFFLTRLASITSQATRLADYDGDEATDIAVYRPNNFNLYTLLSTGGYQSNTLVTPASRIIPEDYTGDKRSDVAWYIPSSCHSASSFFYFFSGSNELISFSWGVCNDIPVGGDYDGDTRTDFTVFRSSSGFWYIHQSLNFEFRAVQWGLPEDRPVPADYDFDGITDIAVYRPSTGTWWILRSSDGGYFAVQFGITSDIPLTGDFDGDGRADFTVYRASEGNWYQLLTTEGFRVVRFGLAADIPVPGDYDGDGRHDIAVFREGIWYLLQSTQGFKAVQWGLPGDVPVSIRYDR